MKEKRILIPPKRLIHLSEENHDGEWFKPRVPYSVCTLCCDPEDQENDTIKRVCFSTSITGAFYAINFNGDPQKLYVHIPENIDDIAKRGKLCKPTEEQVFDADYTDEYWVKCKVKMKCIGYIYITYKPHWLYNRPPCKFKWIEKYE